MLTNEWPDCGPMGGRRQWNRGSQQINRDREMEWDRVIRGRQNGGRRGLFSVKVIEMTKSHLFTLKMSSVSFSGKQRGRLFFGALGIIESLIKLIIKVVSLDYLIKKYKKV